MKEKLKLIKRIQKEFGFNSFRVFKYSPQEEIDNVLSYLQSMIVDLEENYLPKIDEILNDERQPAS